MLCVRSFNNLRNIAQGASIFKSTNLWRPLHQSCALKKSENQTGIEENERVYYGTLTPQIRAVKVFTLTTSIIGVAAQPILYEQAVKLGTSTPLVVGICGFVGIFTFITPVLINLITRKYVTEIHYDAKTGEYTATIITFFLARKEIKFKPEDVIVPEVSGMFMSFLVKERGSKSKPRPLFVDPRLFPDPNHYIKIMGYDKPIDFKLSTPEDTEKK